MLCSSINLDIHMPKIRYIFNKILIYPTFFSNLTCTTVLYKLGLFDSEILYKLQLVQLI